MMISYDNPLKFENCSLYFADKVRSKHFQFISDGLFRIICVTSGNVTFIKNSFTCDVKKGNCIFICPGNNAEFTCDSEAEFDIIVFSADSGKYSDKFSKDLCLCNDESRFIFTDKNVSDTISNICRETENGKKIFSKELVYLFCSELIVYILRHFSDINEVSEDDETANIKLGNRVMEYIDSHIYTMKNLSEVASAMGYNYSYISTLFHKTTGITLNNYFRQKRMDTAKALLYGSKMSISEIARTMNYSSVYAFSKAFKEHFGASPGHYSGRFTEKNI